MIQRMCYAAAAGGLVLLLVSGCGSSDELRRLNGGSATVFGGQWSAWAEVDGQNNPARVAVTAPLSSITAASRTRQGDGPAGAIAVIEFPAAVQANTFFNHFELHWGPQGHPPAIFQVPHFDMHFYGITEAAVRAISPANANVPPGNLFALGYTRPAVLEDYQANIVPQMGFHSVAEAQLTGGQFDATMVLGYYDGRLIFLEPMITQAKLAAQQSFTVPLVLPTAFGFTTRVPRRFQAIFNAGSSSYDLVWSDFVTVN